MKIATIATTDTHTPAVIARYKELVRRLKADPDLLIMYCSTDYNISEIIKEIKKITPETSLHGGTSCSGVMTELGLASENDQGLAMLGIVDTLGRYGVGSAAIDDDPVKSAETAIRRALENSDCPGEVPAMVWLTSSPGYEELLLKGIGNVLGEDVPIAGGSSADNVLNGEWKQFTNEKIHGNGLVVSALFPSTEILFAFHSGYEPTEAKGIITKAGGFEATDNKGIATKANKRTLMEIDGHPAAQVYNNWLGGAISEEIQSGGQILQQTTLHPLGRIAGHIGNVPYYQLSHPESITDAGGITLFSDIEKGDEIVLMQGTIDSLVTRAGRVAASALEANMAEPEEIAGALVVYCAGCMLTVRDRLDEVVDSFRQALPGVPFLGTFTFGEQGCFLNGENRHGNLMISVLLISKDTY